MQSDLSRGGNDRLESQEVEASSQVSMCLSVLSFTLAMWNADMILEKQGLWYLTLFSCAIKVFGVCQLHICCRSHSAPIGQMQLVAACHIHPLQEQIPSRF